MITYSLLGNYGRLGNQLFQIASTIGIATANNQPYSFPQWQYNDLLIKGLPTNNNNLRNYLIYGEVWPYVGIPELPYDTDLQGYFQSWKYFEHCKDLIKDQFRFNIETNDDALDRVAIHVRRGDYLGYQNIHPNLTMDYYAWAMREYPEDTKFSIFSDDIYWCQRNFDTDTCTFILPGDPLTDLLYMSKHVGVITANSSFSWWAGYLNKGKVVCPRVWALNEPRECIGDRIPTDWYAIDND